jgi:hypothetical protein
MSLVPGTAACGEHKGYVPLGTAPERLIRAGDLQGMGRFFFVHLLFAFCLASSQLVLHSYDR